MKDMTKRTISLISAMLLCAGSTVTAFAGGEPELYLRGDIDRDGVISVEDAQLALRAYTNKVAYNPTGLHPIQLEAANVLHDSEFDVTDAQCILKYYVENSVSGKTATWDQVTGRDKLTVPDTGKELVIRAACKDPTLDVMIRQFLERHPEYKGKIRTEYLVSEDSGSYTDEELIEYIANADDTDLFYIDTHDMFPCLNNDDLSIPVSALGFKESDFAEMYSYTLEAGSDINGDRKALSATACPGGFFYRTDLAEKYLGVKTPDEMQKLIGNWEDFEKAAKTVHDQSEGKTAFCDGGDEGMAYAVICNLTEPWFNEKLESVVPDQLKQAAARYTSFYKNGYLSDDLIFSENWFNTVQSDSLFGFFSPGWSLIDEPEIEEYFFAGKDTPIYGKYSMVQGPAPYHGYDDYYMFVSPHCDNKTLAYAFLHECMTDKEAMTALSRETNRFMNNSSVMKELAASAKGAAGLSRQSMLNQYDQIAAASHSPKAYTPACNNKRQLFMDEVITSVRSGIPVEEIYWKYLDYYVL